MKGCMKIGVLGGGQLGRMLALAEEASRKNLKVGVGLMCRHCEARKELHERIRSGAIGELTTLRTYRQVAPAGFVGPKPPNQSELLYQVQRYLGFFWASGGVFHDYIAHNIDECCWMKGAWPVRAQGQGGRQFRGDAVDQNFDGLAGSIEPGRSAPQDDTMRQNRRPRITIAACPR